MAGVCFLVCLFFLKEKAVPGVQGTAGLRDKTSELTESRRYRNTSYKAHSVKNWPNTLIRGL